MGGSSATNFEITHLAPSESKRASLALPDREHPRLPVYVISMTIGMVLIGLGQILDISWHMSIGRDSLWIPPHLMAYLGGALAGMSAAAAIVLCTFVSSRQEKTQWLTILSFQAPLGAFLAFWGALVLLASIPFDNWWHNAYGLDVKISSPPHSILWIGSSAIDVGTVLLVVANRNQAMGEARRKLDLLLQLVGGWILLEIVTFYSGITWPGFQHSSHFFRAIATVTVFIFPIAIASEGRWTCSLMALVYTGFRLLDVWLLPLIPAHARLGPVYHPITHMVPIQFPLLLLVPAFALDLLRRRLEQRPFVLGALAGVTFILVLFAVQWPFAIFLTTPAARNPIFGRIYFSYFDTAGFTYDPYAFYFLDPTVWAFLRGLLIAIFECAAYSTAGIFVGRWLNAVRR